MITQHKKNTIHEISEIESQDLNNKDLDALKKNILLKQNNKIKLLKN